MNTLYEAAKQALAFTMRDFASLRDFEAAKAVLQDTIRSALVEEEKAAAWLAERKEHWRKEKEKMNLRAALAQQAEPEGGGNLPPPLQVPNDVAAILTTTDIAWLETRRLTKLWQELGQMRWAGADEGWDRAIEAVRSRLNDECLAVLYWKLTADKSQATAVELLRKMQGVKYD